MTADAANAKATPLFVEQRRLCLEHAADLIASAERVIAGDSRYPNVAYHLAILAMEEVGKAGMLAARAVTKGTLDVGWIDKRLDDHVQKLMWAVWSPSLSGGKIDPKDFEDARRFAESAHARRMAGLYVDHTEHSALAAPRQAVQPEHATSLLNLAKARLELETTRAEPIDGAGNEESEWFLATISDEIGRKRLFSAPFIKKHEEFRGDSRAWIRWAREEFSKIAAAEKEHLQRELSRQASEPEKGKPKWLMKVRVRTTSHSLRPKVLNFWNDRITAVKLRAAGARNDELILEMTINDHVTVDQLFGFGLSFSKLHLAMLNIGTAGYFWYELPSQGEAYFESIQDLEAPEMSVSAGRGGGLAEQWSEEGPAGRKRRRVALEEAHLNVAIMGLAAFAPMSDEEAQPIFGPYLHGLMLLSKNDLHLSVEAQARDSFIKALRNAMSRFGDLPSQDATLLPALHRVMQPIITDEGHRNQVFDSLDKTIAKVTVADAVSAKRAADLYLATVARRLWPNFVERANHRARQDGDLQTAS